MLQASWRDVGDEALAVRRRPAGEALALDDGAKRVARAVAFGAMARTVDQIGASVPLRRLRRVRHERAAVEIQKLPQADQPANVERKADLVAVRAAGDRRQRLQISKQIARVVERHVLIRRVRERRKQMAAAPRRALGERGDEVGFAPGTDAVFGIGRDIRRIERAERRFQGKSAAKLVALHLVGIVCRCRMARGAAADLEQCVPVGEVGCVRRQRRSRNGGRVGQDPQHKRDDDDGRQRRDRELAQGDKRPHRRSLARKRMALTMNGCERQTPLIPAKAGICGSRSVPAFAGTSGDMEAET